MHVILIAIVVTCLHYDKQRNATLSLDQK